MNATQAMSATELLEAFWPYILIVAVLLLAVLAAGLVANRKTSVKISKDVLDEGAAPAARNQALIDPANNGASADGIPADLPPASTMGGDDLTQIKGLGPKIATMLGQMDITSC